MSVRILRWSLNFLCSSENSWVKARSIIDKSLIRDFEAACAVNNSKPRKIATSEDNIMCTGSKLHGGQGPVFGIPIELIDITESDSDDDDIIELPYVKTTK